MAKHKKPAPAAKKKPSAKPSKPAPRPSKNSKPSKPLKPAKPTPSAKKAAKPSKPAPTVSKKVPPVPAKKDNSPSKSGDKASAKPTAKSTPPIPAKPAAKAEISGKSAPAPSAKPTGKATPPISVPKEPAAAKPAGKGDAKANARDLLRSRILGSKKASKPIAFSLDEVREIAKTVAVKTPEVAADAKPSKAAKAKIDLSKLEKPATPHHIKAASLADILGFNPKKAQKAVTHIDPENVPEKFRKYYKLLLDLRTHLTEGIELHSEETLKRSSKDDSGDLSSYGQHMADAGTDTFDRDFALSLVSSEQEALTEIDAAIKRIHDGTYGICEATQKPIAKDRLLAVPFTRFSAEAQKDIERNRFRSRSAAGLFGEMGEEGATKMADDGGGDDE